MTSAPAPVGGAAYYVGAPTPLNLDGSVRGASDLNPKERGGYDPAFSRADAVGTVRAGYRSGCAINQLAV